MLLNSSAANTLKSNCRLRLAPPELSVPPVVLCASMPLMRTRVNCAPSPRTLRLRPSPASRVMAAPGMRWMASARFESAFLAISSARMLSMAALEARLSSSAAFRLARKPVTTTSSTSSVPGAAGATSSASVGPLMPQPARTPSAKRNDAGICPPLFYDTGSNPTRRRALGCDFRGQYDAITVRNDGVGTKRPSWDDRPGIAEKLYRPSTTGRGELVWPVDAGARDLRTFFDGGLTGADDGDGMFAGGNDSALVAQLLEGTR